MTEYLFAGILVSLVFCELTGLSPGGIVVPAYFAIFLMEPVRVGSTIVLALVCMGVVYLLSGHMILYGRRRFAMFLITGMLLKAALGMVAGYAIPSLLVTSIGWVIPGLLARDMERQGIWMTLLALAVCTVGTRLICGVI